MINKYSNPLSSRLSIKSQAIAIMVAGMTVIVVTLSVLISYIVHQQSQELMLKNAFQITEGLAKQAVFPILSGSQENADSAINQVLGFQPVITARIMVDDDKVFIEKSKSNYIIPIQVEQPTSTQIIDNNSNYWLISTPVQIIQEQDNNFNFENISVIESTKITKETIGYAEVLYSKENLIIAQKKITLAIFFIGGVSVFLLSLLLYAGLVKLFKPLTELESTMEKSEKSGEHTLAQVEGAKEIRSMASSYNSMMHVLEKHEDSITQHRDQLEKEVEIRTKELVQARDSALTASRHKSEFMANMSHELRTPIQSIIGYGELITEDLELDGNFDLIDDMDKVTNNAQRLLNMINSLLDLAKIEAGKLDLNNTDISLDGLIASLDGVITPIAVKNTNQFTFKNQTNINNFITDKEKLEQVLINLLSNACKFTKNGEISLTISIERENIRFDISDSGIGLTPEQQQYIFEEFRQVDASDSRQFGGTGLGLAISQRFLELMNGHISVTSEINKGSIFTVKLPLMLDK